jgi:hypothetical protein
MALLPEIFIPEPTEAELHRQRVERFVTEYLHDFDETLAMVRMGVHFTEAIMAGRALFLDPMTQRLLVKRIGEKAADEIASKQAVIAGLLREANDRGRNTKPTDRINAWKALGRLLGMEVQKVETKDVGTGVMIVPEMRAGPLWEKKAKQAQRKLKREASK